MEGNGPGRWSGRARAADRFRAVASRDRGRRAVAAGPVPRSRPGGSAPGGLRDVSPTDREAARPPNRRRGQSVHCHGCLAERRPAIERTRRRAPRWWTHGLPPQSGTVTADTPPSASPRSAVPAGTTSAPAGGTTGPPAGRRGSDSPRRRSRDDAWLDQPPHNRLRQPR